MAQRWVVVPYATGHLILGSFTGTTLGQKTKLPGASVGIGARGLGAWQYYTVLRVGYTRLFGAGSNANGISVALELPLIW